MRDQEYDVSVVGCGPVGATLLNLMGVYGLSAVGLERESSPHPLSRASSFDGEAMRVFQAVGLADLIEPTVSPGVGMRFLDREGTTLLYVDNRETRGPQAWPLINRMYQPLVEQLLWEGLDRFPAVNLIAGCEVVSLDDQGDRVIVEATDRESGSPVRLSARYVVGCDGASSLVRKAIGSRFIQVSEEAPYLVIDAKPTRALDLPAEQIQYCWPERPHYFRGLDSWLRWEVKVMPGDDPDELANPAAVYEFLSDWVQPDEIELLRAVIYTFHSLVVDRWHVGRVLIAGDAAHVQPPFMGQGLCSGLRDVTNLAWKLAAICREGGAPSDQLLSTYETERKPHAQAWVQEATRVGDLVTTTDPVAAAERDARLLAGSRELRPIAPNLGPGLHGDASPPAGTLSGQPFLSDGRRLDDVVGLRFLIASSSALIDALPEQLRAALDQSGDVIVMTEQTDPVVAAHVASSGHGAILVRPDRYLLGGADTAAELESLVGRIPSFGRCAAD